MTTKGEYRLATNPSLTEEQVALMAQIKRQAADLIDLIQTIPLPISTTAPMPSAEVIAATGAEVKRLKALAQTAIEEGAMWAVKATTKPPAEG